MSTLGDIEVRGDEIKQSYNGRNDIFDDVEEIYFMDDPETEASADRFDQVKLTLSPDGKNQLQGGVRLLTAADPVIALPDEFNVEIGKDVGSTLENYAKKMWGASGKFSGTPIHFDAVLSGMLYSDVDVEIISTQKLVDVHTGTGAKAKLARAKRALSRTPIIFAARNPRDCYPVYDRLGLSEHYRERTVTAKWIRDNYGDSAISGNYKDKTKLKLCEYWNLEVHFIWIKEKTNSPIIQGDHKMEVIPIATTIAEGSTALWDDPEKQRNPFLYTLIKSGLWKRQNLALTVIYTMMYAIGANPMFIYKRNTPGKTMEISSDTPGRTIYLDEGEDFQSLLKQVIDPSLLTGLDIADNKATESTLFKQALGAPVGANSAYSMVALLSQAGRLPLVSPQRKISWLIADAVEKGFAIMRGQSGNQRVSFMGVPLMVAAGQIPEDLEVLAELRISMPQDEVQAAQMAMALTQGDNPVLPLEWVHKHLFNEEDSGALRRQQWREKAGNMRFNEYQEQQRLKLLMLTQQIAAIQAGQGQISPNAGFEAGGTISPEEQFMGGGGGNLQELQGPPEGPTGRPSLGAGEQGASLTGPMNMPGPPMGEPNVA